MENHPAFPRPISQIETYTSGPVHESGQEDMTLLDYFAGQAIQAVITRMPHLGDINNSVADAYDIAEAMLKEREKRM